MSTNKKGEAAVILVSANVGPFRSMNTVQTVAIDPAVTVFVGMNEAGKTVLLKALQKSADALATEKFDPIEDYPRKDLSAYLKQHKTTSAEAVVLTYSLSEIEVGLINKKLGASIRPGHELTMTYKYDNVCHIGLSIDEGPTLHGLIRTFSTDAAAALKDCESVREIPKYLTDVGLTDAAQAALAAIEVRIAATKWANVCQHEAWSAISGSIPKFLYFSDYDLLPGKMNLTDLATRVEQAKADPKQLKAEHLSVLALLRMADVSLTDMAMPGGYEELKAKIEAVSISLTDQVMEFWKQNEDLEVEVDIKGDPTQYCSFSRFLP